MKNLRKKGKIKYMRISPENIVKLKENEIFVFGSNESGIHGAGAAKLAHNRFGAVAGQGFGFSGQTFAIPTKDWNIQTLNLTIIGFYINRFIDFARKRKDLKFLVTEIGCGLAGFNPEDIAPLFAGAEFLDNVYLPESFWRILNNS